MAKPAPKATPAPTAPSRTLNASKTTTNNVTNQAIEDLSNQLMDMRLNLEGLEKERDFYFSKLRDIEILCQEAEESESSAIITKILDILYATEVSSTVLRTWDQPLTLIYIFRMVSLHQMSCNRKKKSIKLISNANIIFTIFKINSKSQYLKKEESLTSNTALIV